MYTLFYTKPKEPSHLRLCKLCNVVEDEEHLVTECVINTSERLHILERIRSIYPDVDSLDKRQMFVLLMGSADARIQKWFGKFLYQSFIIQNHSHEIFVGSNVWLLIVIFQIWRSSRHSRLPHRRAHYSTEQVHPDRPVWGQSSKLLPCTYSQLRLSVFSYNSFM